MAGEECLIRTAEEERLIREVGLSLTSIGAHPYKGRFVEGLGEIVYGETLVEALEGFRDRLREQAMTEAISWEMFKRMEGRLSA